MQALFFVRKCTAPPKLFSIIKKTFDCQVNEFGKASESVAVKQLTKELVVDLAAYSHSDMWDRYGAALRNHSLLHM